MPSSRSGLVLAPWPALLFALLLTGCSASGSTRPFLSSRDPAPQPPAASSPAAVIDNLRWCWEHRDEARYSLLLAETFQFEFAASDSSKGPYYDNPWNLSDERIFAHNLFVSGSASEAPARSITFTFTNLHVDPDLRPGKTWPVHQSVAAYTILIAQKTDGTAFNITGEVQFYVVRGDSAALPGDRAVAPDSTRWYIERWVDRTDTTLLAAPAGPLAARKMTYGQLRTLYR